MSLPLQAIDRLFLRLGATYGRDFTGRYEGTEVNAVKSSWAHELSGYGNRLEAIAWALENLPERAPNVIEFRNLCTKAPEQSAPMLDRPKADPAIVAMVVKGIKPVDMPGRLDWAKRILENPKGRTPTVIQMAKNAMGAA